MKQQHLYLLRHAKSSWKDMSLEDYDRPLSKRGKSDAPMMAKRIAQKKPEIDVIVSSGAFRAKSTAELFADEIGCDKFIIDDTIYEASLSTLLEILHVNFQTYDSVMLVGHNPGLTELYNYLCSEYIDNIPTCGIISLRVKENGLKKHSMQLEFFEYPKKEI